MKIISKLILVGVSVLSTSWVLAAGAPFLQNYDLLRPGKYLNQYYADHRAMRMNAYPAVVVSDVDVSRVQGIYGMSSQEAGVFLKREIEASAAKVRASRFFFFKSTDTPSAVLEMAITELSAGSIAGRSLTAMFGWGQPYCRIEGRLRDSRTNEIIASFSHFDRQRVIFPFKDLRRAGGRDMIREMLVRTSNSIVKEIGTSLGYIPESLKDGLQFKYN